MISKSTVISSKNLNMFYNQEKEKTHVLKDISIDILENSVSALIGPSGSGKSTFLRCINRMNDLYPNVNIIGSLKVYGEEVYSKSMNVISLRRQVGIVFQTPSPFPFSIYDNVAYGPRIWGIKDRRILDELVEKSLKSSALWEEVKDKLKTNANSLSGGQQQRLSIARTLAIEPKILLMDEPTSALDPISTKKIEELVLSLKEKYTIVIVTHNMQQAARISDYTAFFYLGKIVEYDHTDIIFTTPKDILTQDYITGRFG